MNLDILYEKFENKNLIKTAWTHSSYANENRKKQLEFNERLEFLGDSVLSLITSEYLYKNFSHMPEGDLTKIRAALVCEKSLCEFAKEINLGAHLYLGKGEIATNGRERASILADAFEATLGALYLDGGYENAKGFCLPFIEKSVEKAIKGLMFKDYKTALQEIIQQNKGEVLTYNLEKEEGPDHDKKFFINVYLNSNVIGRGIGRTKKEAEQNAATEALELMGE